MSSAPGVAMADVLCGAIANRNIVRFYYADGAPGFRTVEPFTYGYDRKGNLALGGWFLEGASASGRGPGWRLFLLDKMSRLEIFPTQFSGHRPDYVIGGGELFRNSICTV